MREKEVRGTCKSIKPVDNVCVCVYLQQQWKAGKRRAEKDELIAGLFFTTIEHPDIAMERALWLIYLAPT